MRKRNTFIFMNVNAPAALNIRHVARCSYAAEVVGFPRQAIGLSGLVPMGQRSFPIGGTHLFLQKILHVLQRLHGDLASLSVFHGFTLFGIDELVGKMTFGIPYLAGIVHT